jgi:flagellar L-ring protein precursor FlgH
MRRWLIFSLVIVVALLLPYSLKAQDNLHMGARSLFTDVKAHHVGDLLTVMIFEDASATHESNTETKKAANFDASGGPGIGPLDFIPLFGVSADATSDFKGEGSTDRKMKLKARMTVRVTGITSNGDLLIEGQRVIGVNDDKESLTLTGVVRSADVAANNSVASYLIADAQIVYTGRGPSGTASRPGLLTRLLSWIF